MPEDRDDFRSYLRQYAHSEIEREGVRRQAKVRYEERQRDFIVAFHDAKRNIVEPAMQEVEEELRIAGLDNVDVMELKDGECIQLSICRNDSDSHSLCYAIPIRRYDHVEVRLNHQHMSFVAERPVSEITSSQVRRDIKTLLAFAQGQQPMTSEGWRRAVGLY